MTQEQIDRQIETIQEATKKALKSKEATENFLVGMGYYEIMKSDKPEKKPTKTK